MSTPGFIKSRIARVLLAGAIGLTATLALAATPAQANLCNPGPKPTVSFQWDVLYYEGQQAAMPVRLSNPSCSYVTVQYYTWDGTAKHADGDYVPQAKTLVFKPGQTFVAAPLDIVNDSVQEIGLEHFFVHLTNASGATIGDGQATVSIDGVEPQ